MPALLFSLLLLAQPVPTPPVAPSAVPALPAPAAASGAGELLSSTPTPEGLEELKRVYAESCLSREYGMYDDVCSQLSDQLRSYRAALARAERRARAAPGRP